MDQRLLGVGVREVEVEQIPEEYELGVVELVGDVACCDAWDLAAAAALVLTDGMKESMHF